MGTGSCKKLSATLPSAGSKARKAGLILLPNTGTSMAAISAFARSSATHSAGGILALL